MGKMKINQYVVGPVQTNCYFVINDETKEVLIVDPGASSKALEKKVNEEGLKPVAILLTHGHFDHVGAAAELAETFHISRYIHKDDEQTLSSPQLNASWMLGKKETFEADVFLDDEEELDLAGFHIRVLYTPGHTPGGCCYYFPYEDVVFAGDTLFCTSVGRTDFEGGSMSTLIRGIQDKLMVLPERTTVYPGHGDVTTIENERMYNPYL